MSTTKKQWLVAAVRSLRRWTGKHFSADVWRKRTRLGPPPHPNHWGKAVQIAQSRGYINKAHTRRSQRRAAHGRVLRVWVMEK